jgi:hypothetical protein
VTVSREPDIPTEVFDYTLLIAGLRIYWVTLWRYADLTESLRDLMAMYGSQNAWDKRSAGSLLGDLSPSLILPTISASVSWLISGNSASRLEA